MRPKYRRCIEVIAATRLKKGISESELGRRLGKPQSWVDKIESGARRIDFIEFIEIAEALGEKPDSLLKQCMKTLRDDNGDAE